MVLYSALTLSLSPWTERNMRVRPWTRTFGIRHDFPIANRDEMTPYNPWSPSPIFLLLKPRGEDDGRQTLHQDQGQGLRGHGARLGRASDARAAGGAGRFRASPRVVVINLARGTEVAMGKTRPSPRILPCHSRLTLMGPSGLILTQPEGYHCRGMSRGSSRGMLSEVAG